MLVIFEVEASEASTYDDYKLPQQGPTSHQLMPRSIAFGCTKLREQKRPASGSACRTPSNFNEEGLDDEFKKLEYRVLSSGRNNRICISSPSWQAGSFSRSDSACVGQESILGTVPPTRSKHLAPFTAALFPLYRGNLAPCTKGPKKPARSSRYFLEILVKAA